MAFGDNPFASSFDNATPPPAAVAGQSVFDIASPTTGSPAPAKTAATTEENPFLAALGMSSNKATTSQASAEAPSTVFNPFAVGGGDGDRLSAVKKERRQRSQTDSLIGLEF